MRIVIELAGVVKGKSHGRPFGFTYKDKVTGQEKISARIFTDARTRTYEAQIRHAGEQAMAGHPPLDGPLVTIVEARFAVPQSWSKRDRAAALAGLIRPAKKPDVQNISKALDGLTQVVWVDDAQIVDERVTKIYSDRPGLTVIVEALDVPAPARQPVVGDLFEKA